MNLNVIKKLNNTLLSSSAKIIKKMGYSDSKTFMAECTTHGMCVGGVLGAGLGLFDVNKSKKPNSIIKTAYSATMVGSLGAMVGGVSAATLTLPLVVPRASLLIFATVGILNTCEQKESISATNQKSF